MRRTHILLLTSILLVALAASVVAVALDYTVYYVYELQVAFAGYNPFSIQQSGPGSWAWTTSWQATTAENYSITINVTYHYESDEQDSPFIYLVAHFMDNASVENDLIIQLYVYYTQDPPSMTLRHSEFMNVYNDIRLTFSQFEDNTNQTGIVDSYDIKISFKLYYNRTNETGFYLFVDAGPMGNFSYEGTVYTENDGLAVTHVYISSNFNRQNPDAFDPVPFVYTNGTVEWGTMYDNTTFFSYLMSFTLSVDGTGFTAMQLNEGNVLEEPTVTANIPKPIDIGTYDTVLIVGLTIVVPLVLFKKYGLPFIVVSASFLYRVNPILSYVVAIGAIVAVAAYLFFLKRSAGTSG